MALGLIGVKVGMTQVFNDKQEAAPVTVIQLGPCPVLQIRSTEKDGYIALQIGFGNKKRSKAIRAERGHVAEDLESRRKKARKAAGIEITPKANCEPQKVIREFRLDEAGAQTVGQILTVGEVFKDIVAVDVIGTTKGRGFTGVIKRHNYSGLRHSHGVKKGSRQRGSSSSNASNRGSGRPKKGIRMAGQYGNEQVTVRNLTIVKLDLENNLMLVKGAIPGFNGAVVTVRPTTRK